MKTFRRILKPDVIAVLLLIALWLLFFWRLFTPIEADQASLKKGDFSGQFVAFGAYQYARLSAGEIPLWNPYNHGGLPFIADTQAAVFYPARLATIALSKLAGGWTYHALELEMTFHVLAYSLMMYALVRRMTIGSKGSVFGGLVTAIIAAYGGFMTSYPPLQLALLEAAIWLPVTVLGIYEATRGERMRWTWLVLTGFGLGLSWMAGHPQTSYFLTFLLVAYLAYRVYQQRWQWTVFVFGTVLFGVVAGGMAAVQLLPGLEYLTLTSRTGFGFDAKGNGFPFRDVIQFLFPNVVSLWSPLYVGIAGLMLALVVLWRRLPGSFFWGGVALVGLLLSFGANSPIYALLYNVLPGMRFFRGQERAAFLVANSLAILAGLGMAHLANWNAETSPMNRRGIQRTLVILTIVCIGGFAVVFSQWINNPEMLNQTLNTTLLSALTAALTLALIWEIMRNPQGTLYHWLLVGLIVFELFSVNMDTPSNYDPIPPAQQLSMTAPPMVARALADTNVPFRVDGYRALGDNYGSLYELADIRGISPLFLDSTHALIQTDLINPIAWELFGVRYVYSDWQELPVQSEIIGEGQDRYGTFNMHRLSDPRPFAHLVYDFEVAESDEAARTRMMQPGFNLRETVILNRESDVVLARTDAEGTATTTDFKPEQFTISVNTPADAILTIAHPDYPGWYATIDGQPADILRAYGTLQAVAVSEGEHTVQLTYNPITYRVGGMISLVTWGTLGILGAVLLIRRGRNAGIERAK
jgi:hypothetical protein